MKNRELWGAAFGAVLALGTASAAYADFGAVTNTAWVDGGVTETTLTDNTDTDVDKPNILDLEVTKKLANAGPFQPGVPGSNLLQYEITITNHSTWANAEDLDFTDAPTVTGLTVTSWQCGSNLTTGSTFCPSPSGSGDINWTDRTLMIGETITIKFEIEIDATFTGSGVDSCKGVYNVATVAQDDSYEMVVSDPGVSPVVSYHPYDVSPGNDSAEVCTDIDSDGSKVNLVVEKDDGLTYYTPGTTSTYVVTAYNNGNANVPSATVRDQLPAGAEIGPISCVMTGTGGSFTITNTPTGTPGITPPTVTPASTGNQSTWSIDITTGLEANSANALVCDIEVTWSTNMAHYN